MNTNRMTSLLLWAALTVTLSGCQTIGIFSDANIVNKRGESIEVTEDSYAQQGKDKALVLFEASWERIWGCAWTDNSTLYFFGFDKFPIQEAGDDAPFDITIGKSPSISNDPRFHNYAMLVEPGEYGLVTYSIMISKQNSVSRWGMSRSHFKKLNQVHGGTFKAEAGETVYIGNFFLDCYKEPMIWRYYIRKPNFNAHIEEFKKKYPFLKLDNVIFRLFDTKFFGRPAPEDEKP
jgi:hypothetical protein